MEELESISEALLSEADDLREAKDFASVKNTANNIEYYADKIYSMFENEKSAGQQIEALSNENAILKAVICELLGNDCLALAKLRISKGIDLL